MFGTSNPASDMQPNMSGFLQDYATTKAGDSVNQIMQIYSPEKAAVIN